MPSFPSFQGKHAQSSRDINRAVLVGKGDQTGWTGPGRKIPQPAPTVTVTTTGTADRLMERLFQARSHPSSRLDLCRSSPYGPPALGWSPPPHSVPRLGCARRRPTRLLLPMWQLGCTVPARESRGPDKGKVKFPLSYLPWLTNPNLPSQDEEQLWCSDIQSIKGGSPQLSRDTQLLVREASGVPTGTVSKAQAP